MAKRPAEEPLDFDRSQLRRPAKKSSSPVLKILLIVGGGVLLVCLGCGGWFGYGIFTGVKQGLEQAEKSNAERAANWQQNNVSGEAGFKQEAKADLAELAWATAQSVVRSNLDTPPPRLGVGTRGIMFYDQALVGKFLVDEEAVGDGIESRETGTGCEKLLFTFFKEVVVPPGTTFEDATDVSEMSEGDDPADEGRGDTESENK